MHARTPARPHAPWLLLLDPPRDGATNMALDEALLWAADAGGLCALRLYAWNPATLSFGRNEPALTRYDRDAIAARGVATVRRPTGGRAVWHHREVTYAVAAPVATFGTLQQTYQEIHAMLAGALQALGAPVGLAPDRGAAPLGAGACFAAAAGGEVVTPAGGKVVGSAQVRAGNAFLQHGSILLESDQDLVSSLTLGDAGVPRATGLAELLGDGASFQRVAHAAFDEARRRWSAPGGFAEWPAELLERAALEHARFQSADWTWRR